MLGLGWRQRCRRFRDLSLEKFQAPFFRRDQNTPRGLNLILFRLDSSAHGGSMSNPRPVHWQFLILVLAACVSATATPQTRPKRTDVGAAPSGILWVGNSFFYY